MSAPATPVSPTDNLAMPWLLATSSHVALEFVDGTTACITELRSQTLRRASLGHSSVP